MSKIVDKLPVAIKDMEKVPINGQLVGDDLTRDDIIETIYSIQNNIRGLAMTPELEKDMQETFKVFNDRYPSMFTMVLREGDKVNMELIKRMLDCREKIQKGSIDQYSMDIKMGSELKRKFNS